MNKLLLKKCSRAGIIYAGALSLMLALSSPRGSGYLFQLIGTFLFMSFLVTLLNLVFVLPFFFKNRPLQLKVALGCLTVLAIQIIEYYVFGDNLNLGGFRWKFSLFGTLALLPSLVLMMKSAEFKYKARLIAYLPIIPLSLVFFIDSMSFDLGFPFFFGKYYIGMLLVYYGKLLTERFETNS